MDARRWLAQAVLALFAVTAGAAQETIATDRPGMGFSTLTVPRGAVQLEVGLPAVSTTSLGGTDTRLVDLPGVGRVGLGEHLEARLGSYLHRSRRVDDGGSVASATAAGGLELGLKLAAASKVGPSNLALIPSVVLPVGDSEFVPGRPSWTLNGVTSWSLPRGLGLTTVTGIAVNPTGDSGHAASGVIAAVVGRTISGPWSGYVEGGVYPTQDVRDFAYVGGGLTVILSDRLQLDGSLDRGVGDGAADWLLGLGASVRVGR